MISLSSAQLYKLDNQAAEMGISSAELMANAAKGIYEVMYERKMMKRVLIICGSGNNGGDGLALAALYHDRFERVSVLYVSNRKPNGEAARYYYELCEKTDLIIHGGAEIVNQYQRDFDIFIDGLFGIGLSRPIEEPYRAVIEAMNQASQTVLSIDVPSGVDSDDGNIKGIAVKADITVSLVSSKPAHWLYPGYVYSGEITVKNIGIPMNLIQALSPVIHIIDEEILKQLLPTRHLHSHKGSYGKLLGIGGSQEMSGAVLMAGEAALRSGCGMCTLAVGERTQPWVPLYLPECMSIALPQSGMGLSASASKYLKPRLADYDVLFCGCGGGRSNNYTEMVRTVLESNQPCVIDGDGIFALQYLRDMFMKRDQIIVTPHVKEMTYLINQSIEEIIRHPMAAADCFCEQYPNAVLVLKSERPLIAYQHHRYLCVQGNHALAKGGSGDVLCGLIASFYGQGLSAMHAAVLGCGMHAYCAQQLMRENSARSILPHDLSDYLNQAFFTLEKEMHES